MIRRCLVVAFLITASTAQAQTIANPSGAAFTASPDHAVLDLGVPIVTDYALEFLNAASAVVQTVSVGKPTPASGEITVDLVALRPKLTTPPGTYTLRVVARGPGGSNGSTPSVPFTLTPRAPGAPGAPRPVGSSARVIRTGPWNGPSPTAVVASSGATPSATGSDR